METAANPKKFTLTKFSEQNEEEQKENDRKRRKLGNFICKQCNTWLNEKNIVDHILHRSLSISIEARSRSFH